jgi:hypothetical protein
MNKHALWVGGPCQYALNEGSWISDIWLQEHIAPNIIQYSKFEEKEKVAYILAPMWASF